MKTALVTKEKVKVLLLMVLLLSLITPAIFAQSYAICL